MPIHSLRLICSTSVGDVAEGAVGIQALDTSLDVAGFPEFLPSLLGVPHQLALLDQLHDADVPGAQRHDDEDDQRAFGDEVPLFPQGVDAVGVGDDFRRRGDRRRRFRRLRQEDAGQHAGGQAEAGGEPGEGLAEALLHVITL